MEASALQPGAALSGLTGRSPLLRLQSDERLVALTRRGNQAAYEALVQRYQPRLLAFCRHMLSSQEDAEDVLQEVFTAAYNALLADERKINARPWLYRIARNRCLNHLRKPRPAGQDSMDIFERDHGATTADTVHSREEFRNIISDVGVLPESQRTALLLREIDALSYEQIAEAMETTVPSVKSLLVRARVSLAEASEARLLTCAEVRLELGQVAEGLAKTSPPVRRHLKTCDRCRVFRGELRSTTKALAAIYPIGPLVVLKKLGLVHFGLGGGAAAGGAAATGGGSSIAGGASLAGGAAAVASGSATAAGGAISAGVGAIASKAAAGMAAAAIVTAGAVEVKHVTSPRTQSHTQVVAAAPPVATANHAPGMRRSAATAKSKPAKPAPVKDPAPAPVPTAAPATAPATTPVVAVTPPPTEVQEEVGTVTLPPRTDPVITIPIPPPGGTTGTPPPVVPPTTTPPPAPTTGTPPPTPPAPPAGEPVPTPKPPPSPPPPTVQQLDATGGAAAISAAAVEQIRVR